jgi:hypothetical protein
LSEATREEDRASLVRLAVPQNFEENAEVTSLDDVTIETYAVIVDQALCESEAVTGRRLTRSEAEQIVQREVLRACEHERAEFGDAVAERVARLLLVERGYTSGIGDGPDRVVPDADEGEERESFWRFFSFRQAR